MGLLTSQSGAETALFEVKQVIKMPLRTTESEPCSTPRCGFPPLVFRSGHNGLHRADMYIWFSSTLFDDCVISYK